MVTKTYRYKPGSGVPREPQNGRLGLFSELDSARNGGLQENKEGKDRFPGFGETSVRKYDVKRDKIKPLSSLDTNKVLKRSSLSMKHSSLKAVLAATKGPNATEKISLISLEEDKEIVDVEAKEQSNISLPYKKIKQRCSNLDDSSDGSNNNSSAFSKRRKGLVHVSTYQNESDTPKCQERSKFPLFSVRIRGKNSDSDALKKPRPSTSWAKAAQDFSCTVNTSPALPAVQEDLRKEANALPLFEYSDSLKPPKDIFSEDNGNGLSILGAAVFLSLGLDENSHESAKKSECTSGQIDTSQDDDKTQGTNIVVTGCCPSIGNSTSDETVKQSSPNLGADLTLGLPIEFAEELHGSQNNAKVNGVANFSRDEFVSASEKSVLNKNVDKKHYAAETIPQAIEVPSVEKQLLKQDKIGLRTVTSSTHIGTPLKNNEDAGIEAVAQTQLGNKAAMCSLNTDYRIPEDCVNREVIGSEETIGQLGTIRDYMRLSDLSIPLQGTLLLPRGQKRARRLPIQVQRLKHEALKQKKEIGKKEQVSKFSKVTGPSGLLADLNPGIINRVRNSKQVHAIIEAVVGSATLNAYQDSLQNYQQGPMSKSERAKLQEGSQTTAKAFENGDSEIADAQRGGYDLLDAGHPQANSETAKGKLEDRMTSAMNSCGSDRILNSEERPTDANLLGEGFEQQDARGDSILSTECNADEFCLKQMAGGYNTLQGTFSCFCEYCNSTEGPSMDLTCSRSLSVKAATVASQWLELHYQDVKGRLAALKRSRKRVRAVLKEQFGCNSIDHTTSDAPQNDKLFVQASNNDPHGNMLANADCNLHMEKWRSLFIHMDNCLNVEGTQLETSLQQIKEMQTHCMWGLEEGQGITSEYHNVQQPRASEDKHRSKLASADTVERQFALGAAAASIYSTANFVTTMEDVSCF